MISNPRVRVILNVVKDLAVDSAAFTMSLRGILRAAQDDIIAVGFRFRDARTPSLTGPMRESIGCDDC